MSMFVVPRALGIYKAGTLTSTTQVVDMDKSPVPSTITFKSSDASRSIQLSTDGGIEYFTPTYDQTSATMIVVSIQSPVSDVKFTGVANDTWSIR